MKKKKKKLRKSKLSNSNGQQTHINGQIVKQSSWLVTKARNTRYWENKINQNPYQTFVTVKPCQSYTRLKLSFTSLLGACLVVGENS